MARDRRTLKLPQVSLLALFALVTLAARGGAQRPPDGGLRTATAQQQAAADELVRQQTAESLRAALTSYGKAEAGWRALGDAGKEAEVLYQQAVVYRLLGEGRSALAALERSLALASGNGDREREAAIRNQQGLVHWQLDEYAAARSAFEAALQLREALGQHDLEAPILNNLGLIRQSLGELNEARDAYRQALEILVRTGDGRREATALNNLASVAFDLGEPLEALASAQRAGTLAHQHDDPRAEAEALNLQGVVGHQIGDGAAAMASYEAALELFRKAGDRAKQAAVLANLGTLLLEAGESERARSSYQEALGLLAGLEARRSRAETLASLGRAEALLGHPAAARKRYAEALELQRALPDRSGEAASQLSLALLLVDQGESAAAFAALRRSLALRVELRDRPGQARTLLRLGALKASLGDRSAAEAALREALDLSRVVHDPASEMECLRELGRLDLLGGDPRAALAQLEPALARLEALRGHWAGDRTRTSYFGARRETYDLAIAARMALERREPGVGHARRAFALSEAARARGLLDLLRQARVEAPGGGDPALVETAQRLRLEIDAKSAREMRLRSEEAPPARLEALRGEVEALLAEEERVEARLLAGSPRYAELARPEAVEVEAVQAGLLDRETLLLELFLGEPKSYFWRLGSDSFASFELPARKEIEELARRALAALSSPSSREPSGREALSRLSRTLLGPVLGELGTKRLIVVPDGALAAIPFGALPDPRSGEPLLAAHEIVVLPSTSVLVQLRRNASLRPRPGLDLAILADPVFSADDPRLAPARGTKAGRAGVAAASEGAGEAERSARQAGAAGLARLTWTRQEAEAIAAQGTPERTLLAFDFDARRETALGAGVASARFIHFATHGLLNTATPELSGLVLSLVDRQGAPSDGFLRLRDVYALRLAADLVVLSGCSTALGREVQGEGLIGLTRGFLYAGASGVVSSLWPVRDRATAELMHRLYHSLLHEGAAPAAALRAAQLSLRRDPRWRAPYYWAPFVLQGDWRFEPGHGGRE